MENCDESTSLLSWGAQSGPIDIKTGKSAVHYASEQNDFKMVKRMLSYCSTEINRQTRDGDSPLHCSLKMNYSSAGSSVPYTDILKLLLDSNADVNSRNHKGQTPLHIALTRDPIGLRWCEFLSEFECVIYQILLCKEYINVIQMLLDKGAVVCEDNQGRWPVHYLAAYAGLYVENYGILLMPASFDVGLPSPQNACDKRGSLHCIWHAKLAI